MNKLIAVYGSLRAGLHNHCIIKGSKCLGIFTSEPVFSLYSLGSYPGLKTGGNTPVVMEVYEVDERTAARVDQLEGYNPNRANNSFYDKITIETPYGEAGVYIYVSEIPKNRLVESGNWDEFLRTKQYA